MSPDAHHTSRPFAFPSPRLCFQMQKCQNVTFSSDTPCRIHTEPHTIYLTRHGQSQYNRLGKIGGNSGVTEFGLEYARRLAKFAKETICHEDGENDNKARLWTSSMRRTNETAQFIEHPEIDVDDGGKWVQMSHRVYRNLDEIFAGEYEGLTYEEVASRHKDEAFLRKVDKIGYRYPRARSHPNPNPSPPTQSRCATCSLRPPASCLPNADLTGAGKRRAAAAASWAGAAAIVAAAAGIASAAAPAAAAVASETSRPRKGAHPTHARTTAAARKPRHRSPSLPSCACLQAASRTST